MIKAREGERVTLRAIRIELGGVGSLTTIRKTDGAELLSLSTSLAVIVFCPN